MVDDDGDDPLIEAAFPWRPSDDGLWRCRWSYQMLARQLKTLTVYANAADAESGGGGGVISDEELSRGGLEVSARFFITDIAWDMWAVLGCRGMLTAAGMDILHHAEEFHHFRQWVNLQTDYCEDIPDFCLTLPPRT